MLNYFTYLPTQQKSVPTPFSLPMGPGLVEYRVIAFRITQTTIRFIWSFYKQKHTLSMYECALQKGVNVLLADR